LGPRAGQDVMGADKSLYPATHERKVKFIRFNHFRVVVHLKTV